MTKITINIPDDLALAIDRAFPNEEIEAVVLRLLRDRIPKPVERTPEEIAELLAKFAAVRAQLPALSMDEVRRLREEGRP